MGYDDSQWGTVSVPHDWRDPPLSYTATNAVGWYRREVAADPTMEAAAARGQLYLGLGTVSATDKTYLNGQLIGGQGSDSGVKCTDYLTNRQYLVCSKLHTPNVRRAQPPNARTGLYPAIHMPDACAPYLFRSLRVYFG